MAKYAKTNISFNLYINRIINHFHHLGIQKFMGWMRDGGLQEIKSCPRYLWKKTLLKRHTSKIFRLRESAKCLGIRFSRVGKNFSIGRSREIWGNISQVCMKIIQTMKNYGENIRKSARFSLKCSFFAFFQTEEAVFVVKQKPLIYLLITVNTWVLFQNIEFSKVNLCGNTQAP